MHPVSSQNNLILEFFQYFEFVKFNLSSDRDCGKLSPKKKCWTCTRHDNASDNVNVESEIALPASGKWLVIHVDHDIECELPGGQWFTVVQCQPPNYLSNTRNQ